MKKIDLIGFSRSSDLLSKLKNAFPSLTSDAVYIDNEIISISIDLSFDPKIEDEKLFEILKKGIMNKAGIKREELRELTEKERRKTYPTVSAWVIDENVFKDIALAAIQSSEEDKRREELKMSLPIILLKEGRQKAIYETANFLSQNHHFLTMKDTEEVLFYENGVYRFGGEQIIKQEVEDLWGKNVRTQDVNEIINHIKRMTYIDREEFDRNKFELCVKNGILDLRTGELSPFSPDKKHMIRIPVFYDKTKDCEKIKKFISEIVDEEDILLIQEMFGYCLLEDYRFNTAFMLLGEGENGKSTLLNLLVAFLGRENVSVPSLQELCEDPFAKAELYKKLANIHADIPAKPLKNTGNFKMLTGEDLVRGNKKHREPFVFRNHAKLIFSGNELPQTYDTSSAFWRRWVIINFPNTFPKEKRDPNILSKLTTEDELSGLLNWAIEGLRRILVNNGFSTTKSREAIEKEWVTRTDSLRAFISEFIEVNKDYALEKEDFYEKYCLFCESVDVVPISKEKIGRRIQQIIPRVRGERRVVIDDSNIKERKRLWVGITYNDNNIYKLLYDLDVQVYFTYFSIKNFYKKITKKYLDIMAPAIQNRCDFENNLGTLGHELGHGEEKPIDERFNLAKTLLHKKVLVLKAIETLCFASTSRTTSLNEILNHCKGEITDEKQLKEILGNLKAEGYIFEPKEGEIGLPFIHVNQDNQKNKGGDEE